MNTLIIVLGIIVVAIIIVVIVISSKKKKGGEIMTQTPSMPESTPSMAPPESPSSEIEDNNQDQPQI